jgi:hypothetical protein
MPALQFNLIKSIIEHGAHCNSNEIADPSTSNALRDAGLALVTAYIERLSLLGLVCDPSPLFGADGGMWIGYRLTEHGQLLAKSDTDLRRAVAELIGGPRTEVSEAIAQLREECNDGSINAIYKDDFLATLNEIQICFDNECFIATIGLCGKILEVSLKEILIRNEIQYDANFMVGKLIALIKERAPDEYIDPSLSNIVNIINTSRITAVHAKERIPVPSRDQAIMVIFATRDLVRRNLSYRN